MVQLNDHMIGSVVLRISGVWISFSQISNNIFGILKVLLRKSVLIPLKALMMNMLKALGSNNDFVMIKDFSETSDNN